MTVLQRYFWLVKLLGWGGAAVLAARAVVTPIAGKVLIVDADDDPFSSPTVEGEADEDGDEAKDKNPEKPAFSGNPFELASKQSIRNRDQVAKDIVENNVFCPTCLPVDESGTPETPTGPSDGRERPSSLSLSVVGIMESTVAEFSFATIVDGDNETVGAFGVGEPIRANVVITSIDNDVVHIKNGTALEYLTLSSEIAPPPKPKVKPKGKDAKKKSKKKNSREIPGAADAINCASESVCTVEREFVEKLLANPMMLAKQARVIPKVRDGQTAGFKFYGIRNGSLPKLLGLKNGDLLTSVNGEALTSMDKAMGLYTKLRRASNLSVTIERKGKTVQKEIQIK